MSLKRHRTRSLATVSPITDLQKLHADTFGFRLEINRNKASHFYNNTQNHILMMIAWCVICFPCVVVVAARVARRNAHKALINVTLRLAAECLGVAAYGVSEVKLLHAIN